MTTLKEPDMTNVPGADDAVSRILRLAEDLNAEQVADLKRGLVKLAPSRSTQQRNKTKGNRVFPVISRSSRTYQEASGRLYGEVGGELSNVRQTRDIGGLVGLCVLLLQPLVPRGPERNRRRYRRSASSIL